MLSRCVARASVCKATPPLTTSVPKVRHAHAYKAKSFVARPDGPNYMIVQHLLKEFEAEVQKDNFNPYKARAFRRAIETIDELPETIDSGLQARKILSIGSGIARRIDEYLKPDGQGSSKASAFRTVGPEDMKRDKILLELTKVPGIGPVKARKLYDTGCHSLEDLRKPEYQKHLSSSSKAALDFVGHLEHRITRSQVDYVVDTVKSILSTEIWMHAVGSYRRGLPTSADIDIILFHPSRVYVPRPGEKPSEAAEPPRTGKRGRPTKRNSSSGKQRLDAASFLRENVLTPLERSGIVAATLTEGPRKWQGIARIPQESEDSLSRAMGVRDRVGSFRRMDITLYPVMSEGAALLASTGDAEFNTYLRKVASKMGLLLNDFGLWRHCRTSGVSDDPPDSHQATDGKGLGVEEEGRWELIASRTEQEIFEELGMEYVDPDRRNFSFIAGKQKNGKSKV